MGRISTTLSGIERTLLNRLAEANAAATLSALRLATGNKINSSRDDPSGFVRLSGLQSRLSGVRSTMTNVTAASSMVTQAQSTIDGIQTQLSTIRTELLKDETGTLTASQRATAQANIDAALTEINTLAGGEIDGQRLLDGSFNFQISGRNSSQVTDVRAYSTGGGTVTVAGSVTQAATQASLVYTGDVNDQTTAAATFNLTGSSGTIAISVTNGQDLSAVATEVNNNSHKTGITATVDTGAHTLTFTTVDYGTNEQATIDVSSGTFIVAAGNSTSASGTDAQATINGQAYTGDGNQLTVSENNVHYSLELSPTYTGNLDPITIGGSALTFSLDSDLAHTSTLSIPGLQTVRLGGLSGQLSDLASGGTLADLDTNTSQAIRVVDEALAEVTVIEGAVDGFYNASISSTSTLLSELETDLEAAIDEVNLVNSTEETQILAYYQDLATNAVAGLAVLNQQRSTISLLLLDIAGLI